MRPMDAQNWPPEVATDQFALDRTLKHLRKLRKLKKSSPCWTSEDARPSRQQRRGHRL
jgi:hypothetical protein